MEKHTSAWGKGKHHLPEGQAAEGLYWLAGQLGSWSPYFFYLLIY